MNSNDLDRHITGNYGEDFFVETPEDGPTIAVDEDVPDWWEQDQ